MLNKGAIPLMVNFDDGGSGLLDLSEPRAGVWAKMISRLQRHNRAAYVEVDADTDIITQLCVPVATKVLGIFSADEAVVDVAFTGDDALHSLRRDLPDFQRFYDLLQDAKERDSKIMVTATPHVADIIDVRVLPAYFGNEDSDDPLPPPPIPTPISPERAIELFDMVNATTCTPCSSVSPCIPFKYAYSGCDKRAHLMCFIFEDNGVTPEKIWASGALRACSVNVPQCKVGWGFHVAPLLTVIQPDGSTVKMVIDPSLCDEPVTIDYWISLQNYPKALLTIDDWRGYAYRAKGTATREKANNDMDDYRIWLDDVCAKDPPPYDCQCK